MTGLPRRTAAGRWNPARVFSFAKGIHNGFTDRPKWLLLPAVLLLATGCSGSRDGIAAAETAPVPAGPTIAAAGCARALSPDAEQVRTYLDQLTWGDAPGVISGQDCPQAGGICGPDAYRHYVGDLHAASGEWIGILHVDYEYTRMFDSAGLSAANAVLISHWRAGGLAAVSWSPVNPWGAGIQTQFPGADLAELLPGGGLREYWTSSLDRIARALAELREAGVVVLWRPMQEMNGDQFWWAKPKGRLQDSHEGYIRLWRDLFRYFTCEKGLDNLLWVFSPMGNQAWSAFPYPGGDFVDVVAGTSYDDRLTVLGYADFLAYGKPVGVAEYGWGFGAADGGHDNRLIIQRLREDYPRIAYWISWNSWPGFKMSLVDNLFAAELMNDPGVINRGEIAWN
ncbi:MAG: hypothetical protein JW929_00065 [Anaerolineales bacterium]|nr:hypothetical protein [Anaerolineales bacterium]